MLQNIAMFSSYAAGHESHRCATEHGGGHPRKLQPVAATHGVGGGSRVIALDRLSAVSTRAWPAGVPLALGWRAHWDDTLALCGLRGGCIQHRAPASERVQTRVEAGWALETGLTWGATGPNRGGWHRSGRSPAIDPEDQLTCQRAEHRGSAPYASRFQFNAAPEPRGGRVAPAPWWGEAWSRACPRSNDPGDHLKCRTHDPQGSGRATGALTASDAV